VIEVRRLLRNVTGAEDVLGNVIWGRGEDILGNVNGR